MIQSGLPRDSAIATDPSTGLDGIVWRKGSIGSIPASREDKDLQIEKPIMYIKNASLDVETISENDLRRRGVDLNNIWMVEVWGSAGGTNEKDLEDWVMFETEDKESNKISLFTPQRFAKFSGENELRINAQGKNIDIPFTPIK